MIEAIIFDCFGVLTTDGWLPFKKKHFGHDPGLTEEATDLNKAVDAGLADYNDFVHSVAALAGIAEPEARAAIEDNVAQDELFAYIGNELKPRYKIGLLSNAGDDWLGELFRPNQTALFDAIALSYETGFIKPDERAYQIIAKRLGVAPEACVFIDDQERYCNGARDIGMQAICYQDYDQCRRELDQLLVAGSGDTKN